jgi:cobaltochelatase CobS
MKNIKIAEASVDTLIGYYERAPRSSASKARVLKISKDLKGNGYIIQSGYKGRPEHKPLRRIYHQALRKDCLEYQKEGYVRMAEPPASSFVPLDQVDRLMMKGGSVSPAAAVVAGPAMAEVSSLEAVEGKTVIIRDRLLRIREGEFDHIPELDKNYYFTELTNDIVDDLEENKKILLSGHAGCGKTSIFYQLASRINQPVVRVNMNGQTTVGDFVGMYTIKGDEGTVWVDGVLPLAMKMGWWLIIDEIDCADPSILAVLNSVLEAGGTLTLKEKGHEVVKPHADFRILATANAVGCMADRRALYQGTNIMNEAFLDRWRVYHVEYLPKADEIKVLLKKVKKVDAAKAAKMVDVANAVRTSFEKGDLAATFSFRRLMDWAELTVRYNGDVKKAAVNVIFSKVSKEDRAVIEGFMNRL